MTLSGKLLFGAWAVEVIAIMLGLSLAGITSYQAYIASPIKDIELILSVILGGLPFLLVALVEFMKIPLVFSFFKSQSIFWKPAFFCAGALLAVLTFESCLQGFERFFTVITAKVETMQAEINVIDRTLGEQTKKRNYILGEKTRIESAIKDVALTKQREIDAHTERFNNCVKRSKGCSSKGFIADIRKESATNLAVLRLELAPHETQLDAIKRAMFELAGQRNEKKEILNKKMYESTPYRLTQRVHGYDDITDVKQKEVATISQIWFGSIAIIVSILGLILATASIQVSKPSAPSLWDRVCALYSKNRRVKPATKKKAQNESTDETSLPTKTELLYRLAKDNGHL